MNPNVQQQFQQMQANQQQQQVKEKENIIQIILIRGIDFKCISFTYSLTPLLQKDATKHCIKCWPNEFAKYDDGWKFAKSNGYRQHKWFNDWSGCYAIKYGSRWNAIQFWKYASIDDE